MTAARAGGAEEHSGAPAQEGDDTEAGSPAAARAEADPFGTHDEPGYGAGTGSQADPGYGAAAPGSARRPGRQAPARTPEPALGVTPHLDEDAPPWARLDPQTEQIPQAPALKDRPDPATTAPRRGRGAHAARHGKPSRRSRGDS